MTPKQVRDAMSQTSQFAKDCNRPDRFRFMLTSSAIIDSEAAIVEDGMLKCVDANGAIIHIDPQHIMLVANALAPAPESIDVQAGELAPETKQ